MRKEFFESILDNDRCNVVVCDLNHTIIYMNKAAKISYAKRGNLIGMNLLDCHNEHSKELIFKVIEWFQKDKNNNMIHTFYNPKQNKDVYMVALRNKKGELIGYYEKHEFRNKEEAVPYDFTNSLV